MAADDNKMKKVPYTISPEMERGLRDVHDQTGIPIARLVRNGIRKVLAEHGIEVEDNIRQGGIREKAEDKKKDNVRYEEPVDEA